MADEIKEMGDCAFQKINVKCDEGLVSLELKNIREMILPFDTFEVILTWRSGSHTLRFIASHCIGRSRLDLILGRYGPLTSQVNV